MSNAQDKLKLDHCVSKQRLYDMLSAICESKGYQYDMSRSFISNARRAAESFRYGVAELIKHAEAIEARLS